MSFVPVFAFAADWVRNWLTPIWILCVGVVVGLLILGALWGVALLLGRVLGGKVQQFADDIPVGVREGVLWPVSMICIILACFAVALIPLAQTPMDIVRGVGDLAAGGAKTQGPFTIPAGEHKKVDATIIRNQVQQIRYFCTEDAMISAKPITEALRRGSVMVFQNDYKVWKASSASAVPFNSQNDDLPNELDALYVLNMGEKDAELHIETSTISQHPESAVIPITAISIVVFCLVYFLQRTFCPKISAIALSTSKSETGSNLFLLVAAVGVVGLIISVYLPYYTFGEDIKVLKNASFDLITVLCSLVAVWAASNSITEEIEGRTALTVLSKPVSRRSFVIGKFVGIVWSVALLFLIFGLVLLLAVSYKAIFDARENSKAGPIWQMCHAEMYSAVPGLVLAFMQTIVLASISVAISTQLPMMANLVVCFSIYVMGQLTPLLVQSSFGEFEPVAFVGQLIATIFPNLNSFDIQAAVAGGIHVPFIYLGGTLLYSSIYTLIAMLLALILFEDRDLA